METTPMTCINPSDTREAQQEDCSSELQEDLLERSNIEQKDKKRRYNLIFVSTLFTCIVMTVAIVIVCLTTPHIYNSCESKFKSVISNNSFQQNSHPRSITVGDFNDDLWLDVVVSNSGTNTIGIFLNYGNGTFKEQMTFPTGDNSMPLSVTLGDFNNDTYLDIAVTNYNTHNIGIFLNYNNGSFRNQITFSTGVSRPVSIATGDLNNDQCLDIVVANNGTNDISLYFGYGNGTFRHHITYATGYDSFPYSVVVVDLNNDHYLDIVIANYGTDNIGIFLGYGDGNFTTQITYSTGPRSNPYSIAIHDVNNDKYLDIVVGNSGTNNVGVFLGYGNGSFALQTSYSIYPSFSPHMIIVGDFDGDTQLDIAVSNYIDRIAVLKGYGNGSFSIPTIHSTGNNSGPFGMAAGDFNNDNQTNIAIANFLVNNILILIGYGMIPATSPKTYSTGNNSLPVQIVSGDFNNDTYLDLVTVNSGTSSISILLGYGNGSFHEYVSYSSGYSGTPYALTASDIDNDGRLDILVGNSKYETLGILYGYGNGTFETVVALFTGDLSALRCVLVENFNNDDYLDIAVADYGSSHISIFLAYGNRTFGNVTRYSSVDASRTFSLACGDLNHDGYKDIAAANYASDNIIIRWGSIDGTFTYSTTYSTGIGSVPYMLTVIDINNDNYLDIIVVNSGTNNIGIFFGFANGSFSTQQIHPTGSYSAPYWVYVADFNNDDILDLAVANSNAQSVIILLANEQGNFGSQTTCSTGINSQPCAILAGDFNKDNILDIAVANFGTSDVGILLGHPTKYSTNSTFTNGITNPVPILLGDYYVGFRNQKIYLTGSSSQPYAIDIGYFNNDTQIDMIVANSGNQNVGLLLGYGNGSFATEIVYPIGTGSNPEVVIVEDFNKDNRSDVAITNSNDDSIIILLGNDNVNFTKLTYSTGQASNPSAFATSDLNEDAYIDLIVANQGTDSIGIFFGFDYISFTKQKPYETGDATGPYAIVVHDFNNDDYLDIMCGLYNTNNVGVFLGYGNGTFGPMTTYGYVPAGRPWSIAVGDLNRDGQLDVAVANWGANCVSVMFGYGNGSFAEPVLYSTGSRPLSVAIGDFNNDKYLDITVANYGSNNIDVLFGNENGTFRKLTTLSTGAGSRPYSVNIVDINNDTQLDIISACGGLDSVSVFLGYGNGSFTEQITSFVGLGSYPWYAVTGDFNKDGQLDVASANYGRGDIGVAYGYGNGSFGNLQTYSTGIGSNPTHVQISDFNSDSWLDIITTDENRNSVGIFYGYSDGTFASMSIVPNEELSRVYGVAIGDFNNDKKLDFTITNNANQDMIVFLASGAEPFGGQTTFAVGEGSHPSSVVIGHFNNDSQLDIALTNSGTNSIGVMLGYGNRMFSNVKIYPIDNFYPLSLAIGDFNDDSVTDIVVVNPDNDNIVILIGYGDGSFFTLITYSTGPSSHPISVAVGDFNRDEQLDLVVANFGTNNVCILNGLGNGTFTNQTWFPMEYDSRPRWIVFKDLNDDSWSDIIVTTYGTNNIKVLLNLC
ncbi:unnamed protein product [Adineta ricciae]|uniref:Uncharacterized protein n=1 Tax=Adineta ricciae TaxID=249248 RepID=A0A814VRN1_ADIRI|nr:unnamed protein product [Adineta ricciae]